MPPLRARYGWRFDPEHCTILHMIPYPIRRAARGARPLMVRPKAGRALLSAALMASLLAAGCASKSNLDTVEQRVAGIEQSNRIQDQRLSDIERGTAAALDQQSQQIRALIEQAGKLKQEVAELGSRYAAERESIQQRLAAAEGSARVLAGRVDQIDAERTRLTEVLERTQSDLRLLQRRVDEQAEIAKRQNAEQLAAMDAVTGHLTAVQALLQSPLGELPAKTEADKLMRRAYGHLIGGEVDIAAERFAEFIEKFPKDPRLPEAQYRQAQAYFLGRRYDHALVPAFALVDKAPNHALAPEARWVLARSLEEKGDFALARKFYAEMINSNSKYKPDAMRRVQFLNVLQPAPGKAPDRESPRQ